MPELLQRPAFDRAERDAASTTRQRRRRWRDDTCVFRVALAVIAVAVFDDAFVHPEIGMTAEDHLASGLVPLVIAAALALAYPHLRAGVRAVVAIATGVLALTAGIADGFRHVIVDRLAGDDVTVMLAGLAGAGLVALGAATF